MGNKIEPFNLSAAERAIERPTQRDSSCKLGEKVGVKLPKQNKTLPLKHVAVAHAKKDPAKEDPDQYLDFSEVKGMTFRVPTCPCTGSALPISSITVNSPQDFEQLKDDLGRAVWMENQVCGHVPSLPTTGVPKSPELAISPLGFSAAILAKGGQSVIFSGIKASVAFSLAKQGAALTGIPFATASGLLLATVLSSELSALPKGKPVTNGTASQRKTSSPVRTEPAVNCEELWVEEECEGVVKLSEY